MTSVKNSFSLLTKPEPIWQALTDFSRWGSYVVIRDARSKGWGDRWQAMDEPGRSMRLNVYDGTELMQEWSASEWTPPNRLVVASNAWHGSPQVAMQSSLEFTLTPKTPAETVVTIRFESRFTHPLLGFVLSFVPLKKEFSGVLERFEQGLIAALSGG